MQPIISVDFKVTQTPIEGNLARAVEAPRMATLGAHTRLNFTPLYPEQLEAWKQTRRKNTPSAAHILTLSLQEGEVQARLWIGIMIGFLGSDGLYKVEGQYELSVGEQREYPVSDSERIEWRLILGK